MKLKVFIKNIFQKTQESVRRMRMVQSKHKLIFTDTNITTRYKDLAPKDISSQNLEYFKALDWALNNEKVYNIAVAGPYGSGKSSIINSYIKKHPELKHINISLADFLRYNDKEDEICGDFTDDDLELGILKQLFYKVNYKKIPQSRYRKIHIISRKKIWGMVIWTEIFNFFLMLLFINSAGEHFNNIIKQAMYNSNLSMQSVCIVLGVGVAVVTYFIVELLYITLSKLRVREINIANTATVMTTGGADESIFDKNMDEIIYFFEVTKYNLVFIEDLDRFKNVNIFVKLRELNTILNHYEEIKKRIVFLYAIRDDIFLQEDRTKFFEFILPVIPIVNSTNSGEILLERIKKDQKNLEDIDIDDEFIDMISPYISDMRVLDNIYNEFIIYITTLQGLSDENFEKLSLKNKPMFSLIVFKNLYPRVFAELQCESGIVKQAFLLKGNFLEQKRKELEKRKLELGNAVEHAEEDVLECQQEVKLAMLYYMTNQQGRFDYVCIDRDTYCFDEILKDSFDLEILKEKGTVYYTDYKNNTNYCEFDGKEKFSGKRDFIKRCSNIRQRSSKIKKQHTKEIEEIDKEIYQLSTMSMKEVLEKYEMKEILSEEIKKNKLLVFMLREGLIDEKYPNYINYFYGSSITRDDMNFILSIRNRERKEFSYILVRVEQVIKKLRLVEFAQKEVYNFSLMDEILKNNDYTEKRTILFKQLADEDVWSWKFINEYFGRTSYSNQFISVLTKAWKNMWTYIYNNPFLTEERKDMYLNYICAEATLEDIIMQNYDNKIKMYFEEKEDIFKRLHNIPSKKLIGIIEKCDIAFYNLDISECNNEVIEWIFENGYYVLNVKMIQCIFEKKRPDKKADILKRNYTEIMELGYQPLIDKVNHNISNYVDEIFLGIDTNTEEKLEYVLNIINKVFSLEQACKIIQRENVILKEFRDCQSENFCDREQIKILWNEWIMNGKVCVNWNNLLQYWSEYAVTDIFLKYIETNIEAFERSKCPNDITWEMVEEIIYSALEDKVFVRWMKCIPKMTGNMELQLISSEHMRSLIKIGFFGFSSEFAKRLRCSHPACYAEALIYNYETVLNMIENYTIGTEEIKEIIQDSKLEEIEKIQIIKSKLKHTYPEEIAIYLRDVKEQLDKDVYWLTWKALKKDDRRVLFENQIDILDNNDISKCFAGLDEEYKKLSDRSKRHDERLCNTAYNRKLAQKLEMVNYITSYKVESKEIWDKGLDSKKTEEFLRCRIKKQ